MLNIFITILISVASVIAIENYVPIKYIELFTKHEVRYGATITSLAGSDTLSASRTVINNNFSSLNTNKFELSDWYATTTQKTITTLTSLATVGTITTGVWNGTAIPVAYGGTGTTSPSINQVILGNTTSGFKTVNGYGVSGQFLVSNGDGNAPTWATGGVDGALNYNWTGTNLFKNLNASSTVANPIVLNGLSYNTPSTRSASSTTLLEDGSGNLTWQPLPLSMFFNNYTGLSTNNGATTTVKSITVPANTISPTSAVRGIVTWSSSTAAGANGICDVQFGNGSASTTIAYNSIIVRNIATPYAYAEFHIFATSSTAQRFRSTTNSDQGYTTAQDTIWQRFGGTSNYNTAAQTYFSFNCKQTGGSADIKVDNIVLELLKQ